MDGIVDRGVRARPCQKVVAVLRRSKSHIDKRLDAATGNAFLGKQVLSAAGVVEYPPPRRSPLST
ncbi:hypothetical protein AAHH65_11935 [Mycobacterium tuberculosis]